MAFSDGDLVRVVNSGSTEPQNAHLIGKEGRIAGEVKLISGNASYLVMFDDAGLESVKSEFLEKA